MHQLQRSRLQVFLNTFNRSPEYVSLFLDNKLRKGMASLSDNEADDTLDKALQLFRCVPCRALSVLTFCISGHDDRPCAFLFCMVAAHAQCRTPRGQRVYYEDLYNDLVSASSLALMEKACFLLKRQFFIARVLSLRVASES